MNLDPETQRVWAHLEHTGRATVPRFEPSTIVGLPSPARRFLGAALHPGVPLASGVRLDMAGRIKLGRWMPFTARQVLRAGVGLVWAPVVGGRFVRFVGSDVLGPDGARMRFRLGDRVTVVDQQGLDVDRSAAGRLAAETAAWLPQALTPQAGARWVPGNDHTASVILPGPGREVSVDLTIDDDGRLMDIDLQRWKDSARQPHYSPFGATITEYLNVGGVRLAGAGSVGWDRGTRDQDRGVFFTWSIVRATWLG